MYARDDRGVLDYGLFTVEQLAESVKRIEKRLGPQHCKNALAALKEGELRTVAVITLTYYDKTYRRGMEQRSPDLVLREPASANDLRGLAQRLKECAHVRSH